MKRADREHLDGMIRQLRGWAALVVEIRWLAWHLPLSGTAAVPADEEWLLALVERAAGDLDEAQRASAAARFTGQRHLEMARQAAGRVGAVYDEIMRSGRAELLLSLRSTYMQRLTQERERLQGLVGEMRRTRDHAASALEDVAHMPVTRAGVLSHQQIEMLETFVRVVDRHSSVAALLWDGAACAAMTCRPAHDSARLLATFAADAVAAGAPGQIESIAAQVRTRLHNELPVVSMLLAQVDQWPPRVRSIRERRADAPAEIERRISTMLARSTSLDLGRTRLRLLPVSVDDHALLRNLTLLRDGSLSSADEHLLARATDLAEMLARLKNSGANQQGGCMRDRRCLDFHAAVSAAQRAAPDIQAGLDRLAAPVSVGSLDELIDPRVGLAKYLPEDLHSPELLDAGVVIRARRGVSAAANAATLVEKALAEAQSAAERVRAFDVETALRAMDLEVLRKASPERPRVAALANAGLENVWEVVKYSQDSRIETLPGIGSSTARALVQAALRLQEGVREETPVRIDVKVRGAHTRALLEALRRWDTARRFECTSDEAAVATALANVLGADESITQVMAFIRGPVPPVTSFARVSVRQVLEDLLNRAVPSASVVESEVWQDFLSRPADYYGLLTELGYLTEDEAKMHGDLPEEIVEAVRAKELRRTHLTASLRAYQSFGARFALVQKKVVIGDEMGLGKTVEALAVLAHLRAAGRTHFLVVCPAAVVSNWVRETEKHTALSPARLHGPLTDRKWAARTWVRQGGVAITTFDLLPFVLGLPDRPEIGCLIADEAHYIKNPRAKRSMAASRLIDEVEYAVLMTGTPLENNVQEFRNLIGYLRPDLSSSAPEYLPSKFRRHVAPAYLRRNQEDVLTELPELVEVDEWMGMTDADAREYREAVQEGQFQRMRRAAMLSKQSMKLTRLTEIVEEAESNRRRVVVFSYFREVLSAVASALLGNEVFGPLTGSMPADDRQRLIDRFSDAEGGAVLVAQITAGGVGLNIQKASIVVICEPQVKPTMESQAIARAHRMGQTETVQVHRLLSEDSVDERIRDILAEKRHLFDEFARDSVIADRAPDAVDVSDSELARRVIAAERERLFGGTEAVSS